LPTFRAISPPSPAPEAKAVDPKAEERWFLKLPWEIVLTFVLALFPLGWTMFGLTQNIIIGMVCWVVCCVLSVHIFWARKGWRRWCRITASTLVVLLFVGLILRALLNPPQTPATKDDVKQAIKDGVTEVLTASPPAAAAIIPASPSHRFPIYMPFVQAYNRYASQLGEPTGEAIGTDGYQAKHDKAWAIWLNKERGFFLLDLRDDTNPIFSEHSDSYWKYNKEDGPNQRWTDDDRLRRTFHTPGGKLPPYSGVAKLWSKNQKNWRWIGWREWHCSYIDGTLHYQTFDGGLIMGEFLLTQQWRSETNLFILLNTGKRWKPIAPSIPNPSSCVEPVQTPLSKKTG